MLTACAGGSKPAPDKGQSDSASPPADPDPAPDSAAPDDSNPAPDTKPVPEADPCAPGVAAAVGGTGYPSLEYALLAAPTEGVVEVCPGDWQNIVHIVRDVTGRGRGRAGDCQLDGGGGGPRVLGGRGRLALEHLTVHGGYTEGDGGGIRFGDGGSLHARDVALRDNTAGGHGAGYGGGAYGSNLFLFASRVEDNAATSSGGGFVAYGDNRFYGGVIGGNTAPEVPQVGEDGLHELVQVLVEGQVVSAGCAHPSTCGTFAPARAQSTYAPPLETEGPDPAGCGGGVAGILAGVAYDDLAEAVAAAGDGEVVEVCAGTWPATLVVERDVTLRGTAGADAVVLDGGGEGRVIEVRPGAELVLEGLSVTGGYDWAGGGILVSGGLDATKVVIRDNTARYYGGAVAVDEGATGVRVRDSRLYGNVAGERGGALWVDPGLLPPIELDEVVLAGNYAVAGGGLHTESDVRLVGGEVEGNRAAIGAGAWCADDTLTSEAADWGVDADDNLTGDVYVGDTSYDAFGAAATFTCDEGTRTCG